MKGSVATKNEGIVFHSVFRTNVLTTYKIREHNKKSAGQVVADYVVHIQHIEILSALNVQSLLTHE